MTVMIKSAAAAGALLAHPGTAAAAPGRALGLAALVTWLFDAASGGYMLRTWIARGGLRRERTTGDKLAPAVVFGHFGMASTGLLVWVSYVATRWAVLGWLAMGLLMLVIGLGISTVTLWTPFPARGAAAPGAAAGAGPRPDGPALGRLAGPAEDVLTPAVTDDMLARALTDEALLGKLVDDVVTRAPRDRDQAGRVHHGLLALIPASHGLAAITTMLLALLTVVTAAR